MQMKVDGQRVKALRLRQSWSQELLAEKAGISLRTIQRIEAAAPDVAPRPPAARCAAVPFKDLLRTALPAVAVTLLFGAGIVYLAADSDLVRERGSERTEPVPRIVTVGYGDIEHAVGAQAKLQPSRITRVEGVPGARVERIVVAVGDEVAEDQPVAYLDARALRNRVESAEAGAAILRSQLTTRRSAVQLAMSRLEEAERRYATEGGDELAREFEEARHGVVKAQAELFEAEQRLRAGDLDLYAVRGERRWQGTLRKILPVPAARDSVLSYQGIVELDNSDGVLKSGMTAQVLFPLESAEDVLVVPVSALTNEATDGQVRRAAVRVVSPDGGTEVREIVVGAVDRINAEVLSGLREGERVLAGDQSS